MVRLHLEPSERAGWVPPGMPYLHDMIIARARHGAGAGVYIFDGMGEAAARTGIHPGRIRMCIETGRQWRGWTFGLV